MFEVEIFEVGLSQYRNWLKTVVFCVTFHVTLPVGTLSFSFLLLLAVTLALLLLGSLLGL